MNAAQKPLGFAVVAFLITVIFILVSWGLRRTGDVMCQRNESRFKTLLVTCRLVHVAKLGVGRDEASPCTRGNKRTVLAVVPWVKPLEFLEPAFTDEVVAAVDMAGGESFFASE